MTKQTDDQARKISPQKDAYDIDFDFNLKFGVTDYCLMLVYLVCLLPIELISRISSDCYGIYQARKANEESMRSLVLE